jgi:hypothetical protein
MKVLGKVLVSPFDAFWRQLGPEIGVPAGLVEEGDGVVFGPEGYEKASNQLPRWMKIPDGALSYHVAHELTHLLLKKRGFPVALRGPQYGPDSSEARVGGDLEEMISHPALEEVLRPFPFDKGHIQEHLFEGARHGLETSPVPGPGSPWWVTWACRCCELQFLLPRKRWIRLEVVYDGRCSDIAEKGRELAQIMRREGFLTPDQALQSMIGARDALGLKEADRCLVHDPRNDTVY